MRKLAQPTWHYILEAAKEFNGKPFTSSCIVDSVIEKAPRAKSTTIFPYLYAMTLNHPSNKTYPHILKNHVAFAYLEDGRFQMLEKAELFKEILIRTQEVLKEKPTREAKLKAVCRLLRDNVTYYNWAGFYFVDKEKPDELVLGPFVGEPTEHTRILFGKGICGQAASLKKTFVVQDVSKENNYLACSSKVKSEIIVPVFKEDQIVGELDIDSHAASPFTEDDEVLLAKIAKMASDLL